MLRPIWWKSIINFVSPGPCLWLYNHFIIPAAPDGALVFIIIMKCAFCWLHSSFLFPPIPLFFYSIEGEVWNYLGIRIIGAGAGAPAPGTVYSWASLQPFLWLRSPSKLTKHLHDNDHYGLTAMQPPHQRATIKSSMQLKCDEHITLYVRARE